MFTNPEQFAAATKALFEFQLMTFSSLTNKAVQGVDQVVSLNMAAAKTSLAGTIDTAMQMGLASNPQAALNMGAAQIQPKVEDLTEYNRNLTSLISGIQAEFTTAADAHIAEAKSNLTALIYDVTKSVPPGSENAVAIVKEAISNAFTGYEQVTIATRQAVKAVEAHVAKATEQFTEVIEKTGFKK